MLYIAVSLESKDIDNSWKPTNEDIFSNTADSIKSRNVKLLFSNERKSFKIPADKLFQEEETPTELYRFSFDVRDTPFRTEETVYSQEFTIKQ